MTTKQSFLYIEYVRTGEFDLNTLRVEGGILESGEKKVADSKIPGNVWKGPWFPYGNSTFLFFTHK